jgi:hypothetical protein
MKKHILLFLTVVPVMLKAQENIYSHYITINTNLYAAIASDKQMYPMLWYNKDLKPKIMVGGFGAGFTMLRSLNEKSILKLSANLSRSVYWDESVALRNDFNEWSGTFYMTSTDVTVGLAGIYHLLLNDKFSVGAGASIQTLLMSTSRFPEKDLKDAPKVDGNSYYKPIMPMIPIEITYRKDKWLLNLRYEQALLNRYKKNMADDLSENYGLIFFEVGYKIW